MKKAVGLAVIMVALLGMSFLYVRGSSHAYLHTGLTPVAKPSTSGPLMQDGSMCVSVSVIEADGSKIDLPQMQTQGIDFGGLSEDGKAAMAGAMRDAIIEKYNATLMQQGKSGIGLVSDAFAQPKCAPGECGGPGDCVRLCYGVNYRGNCVIACDPGTVDCWHYDVCSPCNYFCYLPCCSGE